MDDDYKYKEIRKKPVKFSSENQPKINNKGGRKPSALTHFIKGRTLTSSEVSLICRAVLFGMTETDIKIMEKDPRMPVGLKLFAKALRRDLQRGSLLNFEIIMRYAYGKPKETVEIKNETTVNHVMSIEETKQKAREILERMENPSEDLLKVGNYLKPKIYNEDGQKVEFPKREKNLK